MTLSAVIITQNEQRNIGRCLESLKGLADEIIVVDSGSTDNTPTLCQSQNVRFVHHDWEGYSGQKNFAETLATCDWVLSIDADEALSDTLRDSILEWKQGVPDSECVYAVKRLTNYCGSWIRHCGWYPDTKVRLWQRGSVRWVGTIHEELQFSRPMQSVTFKGDLLHYSYYTIEEHASRQPRYYQLAATDIAKRKHHIGFATICFKPLWTFVRDYLFKGGILDGQAGFLVCKMNAHYTFMKYATAKELTSKK